MVIHEPGDWLLESLRALVHQDYPGLQTLLLITGTSEGQAAREVQDIVDTEAPGAVVRFLGSNPGYARACNSVLDLVQGENGLFCFLHDDVALAPDAISAMVVEMHRSNAALVGPKLVFWDDPSMIQSVGSASDRFGVELPYADIGERDQEQHDAIQDVFVLPTACVMVRADLFRALGGFSPGIGASGQDLDFCWRVHTSGARVVVVPAAVARHREAMSERPDADGAESLATDREAERARTVMVLTPGRQLPLLVVEMVLFTALRAVLLAITGRIKQAAAETMAVVTLPRSVPDIAQRRRGVAAHRVVGHAGIRALQIRGSSHATSFLRRRARQAGLSQSMATQDAVEATPRGSYVMWSVLLAVLIIGSRELILGGVASVGQMVPFGESARSTLSSYLAGWWSAGFGHVSALPTGVALTAVMSLATFGNSGIAHTLAVVGLPLVGWVGAWRLASVLGTRAARIGGTVAYAAVPLPWVSIATGRWGALLVYGALPWMLHLMRMLVGHADVSEARATETMVVVAPRVWRRWWATLVLLTAIVFAFEPSIVALLPFTAGCMAAVLAVQGLKWRWTMRWVGISAATVASAVLLNMPWSITYVRDGWWEALFGAPVESGRRLGLWSLAMFDVGPAWLSVGVAGLYAAVVGAVFLVRGARAQWALRGATLVGAGLLLAIADDAGLLPLHAAEPAVMLVPVAVGLSLCAGAMVAALASDLGRGKLTWRQPFAALVGAVFAVGLVPTTVNSAEGSWHQPSATMSDLLSQLPDPAVDGEYRTLFIGDSRVLPGAPLGFGWGISYSIVNGATASVDEHWEMPETTARANALAAMYGIVRGQTSRAGRLLGPLSVRFIVVPVVDGAQSSRSRPIPAPPGLVESLSRQLDLRRRFASPDLAVFENTAWVPLRSMLTAEGARSSELAGASSMITADISGAASLPVVDRQDQTVRANVDAGTLHVATPFSSRWKVRLDGVDVQGRPAFGLTNAYDIASPGTVELRFESTVLQRIMVPLQLLAWVAVASVAVGRRRRRGGRVVAPVVGFAEPAMSMEQGAPR